MIATLLASQPGAPYLMTQTILVQEHALKAAQDRVAELEAKVNAAPPPSFLGSAPKIGPWGSAPAAPAPVAAPMPSAPSPLQAAVGNQPSAAGGFLRSAMTTAAGVAGGALLFEGIRGLFGHSSPFGGGGFGAGSFGGMPFGQTTIIEENNASPLMPPDQWSPADASQTDSANTNTPDNYDQASASDDYDTSSDDSGFGASDSDDIV